jgi:hypothetical protein
MLRSVTKGLRLGRMLWNDLSHEKWTSKSAHFAFPSSSIWQRYQQHAIPARYHINNAMHLITFLTSTLFYSEKLYFLGASKMHHSATNKDSTLSEDHLIDYNYSETKHQRNESDPNSYQCAVRPLIHVAASRTGVRGAVGTPPLELMSRPRRNTDHTLVACCYCCDPPPTLKLHRGSQEKATSFLRDVTPVNRTRLFIYHITLSANSMRSLAFGLHNGSCPTRIYLL